MIFGAHIGVLTYKKRAALCYKTPFMRGVQGRVRFIMERLRLYLILRLHIKILSKNCFLEARLGLLLQTQFANLILTQS